MSEPELKSIEEDWDYLEVYGQKYQRSEVYLGLTSSWYPQIDTVIGKSYGPSLKKIKIEHRTQKIIKDHQAIKEYLELTNKWRTEGKGWIVDNLEEDQEGVFDKNISVTESFIVSVDECKFYKNATDHELWNSFIGMPFIYDPDCPPDHVYYMDVSKINNPFEFPNSYGSSIHGIPFKIDDKGNYEDMVVSYNKNGIASQITEAMSRGDIPIPQPKPKTTLEAIEQLLNV